MSLIDRYARFVAERLSSDNKTNKDVIKNMYDPNHGTPDIFFTMDEVGGRQILRKFNKAAGMPVYLGTYRVLYKTEDLERFCIVMKRTEDEWAVPPLPEGEQEEDREALQVAEYYPSTHGRIHMRGLSREAVDRIVARYEKKLRRKQKKLTGAGE